MTSAMRKEKWYTVVMISKWITVELIEWKTNEYWNDSENGDWYSVTPGFFFNRKGKIWRPGEEGG